MNYKEKIVLSLIIFIIMLIIFPIFIIFSGILLALLYFLVINLGEYIKSNINFLLCVFSLITFINLYIIFLYMTFKHEKNILKGVKNERSNKSRKY